MLLFIVLGLAAAQFLVSRTILSELAAVGEVFTVRYQLSNGYGENVYNVTLTDGSFRQKFFRFVEGKTSAVLTYGTMRPNQTLHVDLELVPKLQGVFNLTGITVNFAYEDESYGTFYLNFTDTLKVISATDYKLRHIWEPTEAVILAAFFVMAAVAPLGYSLHLRLKRFARVKAKIN